MKLINSTRTIHAANLQTALLLNKPYVLLANSTLNERFNVNPDVDLLPGEMPAIGYYTIGRGGHQAISGTDGGTNVGPVPQSSINSALFKPLPFVLRPMNDDLGATDQARYALRKIEQYDGVNYFAYYLKRIDLTDVNIIVEYNTVLSGGETTSTAYTPSIENLTPTPITIPVGSLPTAGDSLSAIATAPLVFADFDAVELRNACSVIYGDPAYAVVSEIGICSGVDRTLLSPLETGEANVLEAVGVQVLSMITTHQSLTFNNGFTLNLDLGSAEPL